MKYLIITAYISLIQCTSHRSTKYDGYESDDTSYVNGQILVPDMIHPDTLVVLDADYLNKCLGDDMLLQSDDDLIELLNETTAPYNSMLIPQHLRR